MDDVYPTAARSVLESLAGCFSGDPIAEVLCLKGVPGPAEKSGESVGSGPDGEALAKALPVLGYDEGALAFLEVEGIGPQLLREAIEAVDPAVVVTLDPAARTAACGCLGVPEPDPGVMVMAHGRALVAVDSFETSLASEDAKRIAWHQLKAASRDAVTHRRR